jgi:diaminohydroxyphosphoribosylaminopyrimidine deaminase/5-amino-6-(5-phosphoribosylamino)uracil reductase
MRAALSEAKKYRGATAPNPPVGAAALSLEGELLGVAAHPRAGESHAEARLIEKLRAEGMLGKLHTLVVTLEPCNHHGRTPPCTEAILASMHEGGARRVVYGVRDSNPQVRGGGAERLAEAGIEVSRIDDPELARECEELVAPFFHWLRTGLPWVTVKTAFDSFGSMLPPAGEKTFSSPESLRFAHELRKRSDAILTGSGTVISDAPLFTVRNVEDHPGKRRVLVVLDRRGRIPADWVEDRAENFDVVREAETENLERTLKSLGERGVHEVLVEAGPTVASAFLEHGLWNEHYMIHAGNADTIERRVNPQPRPSAQ